MTSHALMRAGAGKVRAEMDRYRRSVRQESKSTPGLPTKTAKIASKLALTLAKEVNETMLLHGTAPDRLLSLLSNGLNERFSGSSAGTAFGDGIYLAEDSGKTDQYVTMDRCKQYSNCSDRSGSHSTTSRSSSGSSAPRTELCLHPAARSTRGANSISGSTVAAALRILATSTTYL